MSTRVVITGIGMVTPLGVNSKETWTNIIQSKSGISSIKRFEPIGLKTSIAGQIDLNKLSNTQSLSELEWGNDNTKLDLFMQLGLAASIEAVQDANIEHLNNREQIGVYVGSGIGGLSRIFDTSCRIMQDKKVNPFFIPSTIVNLLPGHISIRYKFHGPNLALATACTTGTHCIGEAARIIKSGDAKIMVAGSAEAPVTQIGVKGFNACSALTTQFNSDPTKASRPWDKARSGFVMSEGAGIVVLEEYEHAKKRNAKIYAEVIGYGTSADATHITAPNPQGAKLSIVNALKNAKISPDLIEYVNAHGTSTQIGDQSELNVIESIFSNTKQRLYMSSTKGALGHMLGGAGSVELALCVLAIKNQTCPPTLNLEDPIATQINLVPKIPIKTNINYVLTNSFGFGGTNASIILKKI